MKSTIRWTALARARIAPRTADDLAVGRRRRTTTWKTIQRSFQWLARSIKADEPDLASVVSTVFAWQEQPTSVTDDELAVWLVASGEEVVWEFLAKTFGTARVAAMLVAPPMTRESGTIVRKKRPPNGVVLRAVLVGETDAAIRASCRAAAQSTWDAGDVAVHEQLAYAFFEDETWRAQAMTEILEQAPAFASTQLALARDATAVRTLLARCKKTDEIEYVDIVASLGEDALPILIEAEREAHGNTRRLSHAIAVSVLSHADAAKHLAKRISHPATRGVIGDYFARNVPLAAAVLPAASEGASRNAALAKELLIKVCGDRTADASEVTAPLSDPAVPRVLRDAPWRTPPAPLPNLGLDVATWNATVALAPDVKEKLIARLDARRNGKPFMTDEEARAFVESLGTTSSAWNFVHEDKAIPFETVLALHLAGRWSGNVEDEMVAMFGVRALPHVRTYGAAGLARDVRDAIDDAAIALRLAEVWMFAGNMWSWFEAHPRAAAFGLLARAHERDNRHVAEIALKRLARDGHGDVILSLVPQEHEAVVRAILERDPQLDVPSEVAPIKTHPKVKRPRLKDGRSLDDEAMTRLFEMLSFTSVGEPYVGIEQVKAACDPRSLAETSWDLAAIADGEKRWKHGDSWMQWSLAHFADDQVIRRLTPALKHNLILTVLERLAIRGVRSAAMELATAFERGSASHSMHTVAYALDTSVDAFAETLLPTTPLVDEGTTPLVYGSRTLRVGFDTTLAPILFLDEKRLAALPRAKPTDDPIAVRLARETWDELKEDVRTIARLRNRALENAMRSARRFSAKQFREGWATHPLGKHQTRAMVWAVERGDSLVTFRVAEDSTLADSDDAPFTLEEDDVVRVPHYAELGPKLLDPWTRTFTDYQLIQPVAQLARVPLAILPGEENATEIVRDIAQPYAYSVYSRILAEHGVTSRMLPQHGHGTAELDVKTKWMTSHSMCISVTLVFREGETRLALGAIDPVDRAEALYLMRAIVEGS